MDGATHYAFAAIAESRTRPGLRRLIAVCPTIERAEEEARSSKFWGHPDAEIDCIPVYGTPEQQDRWVAGDYEGLVESNVVLLGDELRRTIMAVFDVKEPGR